MFDPDPKISLRPLAAVRPARLGDEEVIRAFGKRAIFAEPPASAEAARILDRYWSLSYLGTLLANERAAVLSRSIVAGSHPIADLREGLLHACERGLPPEVETLRACVPFGDAKRLRFHEARDFAPESELSLSGGGLQRPFVEMVKRLATTNRRTALN